MSYYFDHIIECDKLVFERMLLTGRQKGWENKCILCRPRHAWSSTDGLVPNTKAETYLLYFVVNHQPDLEDIIDWLEDDLGIYGIHFSIWSQGECDKDWKMGGSFVPKGTMPHHTVPAEYDRTGKNNRKAPEGYTTYEDCMIAVDAEIWKELAIDYTREEEIHPRPPIEEILQEIDAKLDLIEGLLECLVERGRE